MRKSLLIVAVAVTLLAACSGGGQSKKERKYTPLSVYFDPLLSQFHQDEPAAYYIDFINYPNDTPKEILLKLISTTLSIMKGGLSLYHLLHIKTLHVMNMTMKVV